MGVFVGIAPLMPLKTVLILAITFIFPCSTVAAWLVCTVICNPLTYIPLYYVSWLIGSALLPGLSSWLQIREAITNMQKLGFIESLSALGKIGLETALVVLSGGCLLALIFAVISYPIASGLFERIALKRREKHYLENR